MLVPLHDQNPLRYIRAAWMTRGLVLLNVLIFLVYQRAGNAGAEASSIMSFGLIPSTLEGIHIRTPGIFHAPELLTFVTASFLHANLWHVGFNMLFLWIFGDNVEDAMGPVRFLIFYLLCAIGGGIAHVLLLRGTDVTMIGASGSVAGVLAAYLILHPRVKISILLFWIPMRIQTVWVIGLWIALQLYGVLFDAGGGVSFAAHLGGIITGALLILFMRRSGVPLLARDADEIVAAEPTV